MAFWLERRGKMHHEFLLILAKIWPFLLGTSPFTGIYLIFFKDISVESDLGRYTKSLWALLAIPHIMLTLIGALADIATLP